MVVEAGQRIAIGQVARLLVEPRVLEGHRRLVGHRPGQAEPFVVEGDRSVGDELDQPDRLALGDERQHGQDLRPVADHQLDLGRVGGRIVGIDDDRLLALEDAERLRVAGDLEVGIDLGEPVDRVVAHRFDPAGGAVPVADDAFLDAHRAGQVAGHQLGDLARVEAARQLGAHVEQATQLAGQVLGACQQAGRSDRRGRLVGEDRQQPQVVGSELVEPELGERDDADRRAVVAHRDDQHRLVDVVGPGDRHAARVAVGVLDEDRFAVQRDPAGEALAERAGEELHVDVLVRPDPSLERDRHDLVGRSIR